MNKGEEKQYVIFVEHNQVNIFKYSIIFKGLFNVGCNCPIFILLAILVCMYVYMLSH